MLDQAHEIDICGLLSMATLLIQARQNRGSFIASFFEDRRPMARLEAKSGVRIRLELVDSTNQRL